MKKIIIINGPNLNLLGEREVELYGTKTLKEIEKECCEIFKKDKLSLNFFQSNSESEIIDKIHICKNYDGMIINAAAFTHNSVAIRDSLDIFKKPIIEVHICLLYTSDASDE